MQKELQKVSGAYPYCKAIVFHKNNTNQAQTLLTPNINTIANKHPKKIIKILPSIKFIRYAAGTPYAVIKEV